MPGAPFNPATGERAPLGAYPGRGTTLALFQVVGDDPNDPETADTHDNYVVCRGYEADNDPNFRYLHDPYTKPDTTPINVAKPYSLRGTFPYKQGQVIVAARIKGRLGYNAGKAATVGQPEDLDDELELLTDDDNVGIAWLDLTAPIIPKYPTAFLDGSATTGTGSGDTAVVTGYSAIAHGSQDFSIDSGTGVATYHGASGKKFLQIVHGNVFGNTGIQTEQVPLLGRFELGFTNVLPAYFSHEFGWGVVNLNAFTNLAVVRVAQPAVYTNVVQIDEDDTASILLGKNSSITYGSSNDQLHANKVNWMLIPLD